MKFQLFLIYLAARAGRLWDFGNISQSLVEERWLPPLRRDPSRDVKNEAHSRYIGTHDEKKHTNLPHASPYDIWFEAA